MTEQRLGGWSLFAGTVAVAAGFLFSPGRGIVDSVPSTSLADLTLAMARNALLSYTVPVVIVCGALLMLNGLVVMRQYAAPIPRLGLLGMAVAQVLQMAMRGFDYMIVGMGAASLEGEGAQAEVWLRSAVEMQRTVWGLHFTSVVAGFAGIAVMAAGLVVRPEPVRLPPWLNAVVAVLAVASLAVFVAAWMSNELELALAPVFGAMSVGGLAYMALLGWRLATADSA